MPDATFPMRVLPVSTVLALKRLPKHEDVVDQLCDVRGVPILFSRSSSDARTRTFRSLTVRLLARALFIAVGAGHEDALRLADVTVAGPPRQ